jgi:O-antigen/teichoic acid export membrane protein
VSALFSTAARVLTMCVSLVCGVLSARLVIGEAGVGPYALLSLLVALPSLISFSDLGAGAVLVNAVATSPGIRTDTRLAGLATTVVRVTLLFGGSVALVDVALYVTGGWRVVLGSTAAVPGAVTAAFVCVLIFCVSISMGVWQRILLGLGRNPIVILLQGMISPLSLLIIWLLLGAGGSSVRAFLALGTFLATLAVAVCGVLVADRFSTPLLREVARRVLRRRRYPGVRVMDVGWPMFAQMLAAPLSLTLPRYILAQTASHQELAQYALAGQVFFAFQALIGAAGVTLWPAYARARAAGGVTRGGPFLMSGLFTVGAAGATAVVVVVGPWFFAIVSKGEVAVGTPIVLAFGAMIVMQAALYPLGMFIMDKPGIRFQVAPALLAAASTVVLSVFAAPAWGVVGPLLSNAVSVLVIQIIPFAIYIRRHRARLYGATGPITPGSAEEPALGDAAGHD